MDATLTAVVVTQQQREEVNDTEYYLSMVRSGLSESTAALATDYRIAYRAAQRRLERQGLHRPPTGREVCQILASM